MSQKLQQLKDKLKRGDQLTLEEIRVSSQELTCFKDVFTLRRIFEKSFAHTAVREGKQTKVAIVGGVTLYPLHDLLRFYLDLSGRNFKLFVGEYKNYFQEILNTESELYLFAPDVVVIVPEPPTEKNQTQDCRDWKDFDQKINEQINNLEGLCNTLASSLRCNIIVCNSVPSANYGFGNIRGRLPGTDWTTVREFNFQLARTLKNEYFLCDLEFLASRCGLKNTFDERFWLESKNVFSPDFIVEIAKELCRLIETLKVSMKKCLVLDLDNTLWGGVIGDDGLGGIEIGDLTARGLAFKRFQQEIKKLKDIGVILGIASKNEMSVVLEGLNQHPDMVLRESDFVCIKANWEPKSQNIQQMAAELNLGLDSFVFIDDNPAEIEIVNQFLPDVTTVLLGSDPADYVDQLSRLRLFEPFQVTDEDKSKTEQYITESLRAKESISFTNMDEYLKSLNMEIEFSPFTDLNLPRVVQLINKSNQFNLTARRRTSPPK
ncbi:MAG: HAD-IIIC family phosphatase [Pseudobdellovibrionaceae bacterium]